MASKNSTLMTCRKCGRTGTAVDMFLPSKNPLFDGFVDVCYDCLYEVIDITDLNSIDMICRWANIAFLPNEWMRFVKEGGPMLEKYGGLFARREYYEMNWKDVNEKWKALKHSNELEANIDELRDQKEKELKSIWIGNYSMEELLWLQRYYNEMEDSYDIRTPTHRDLARKVCKVSMEAEKAPHKDLFKTLIDLMKAANFTEDSQKAVKGITSVGEIFGYMEETGFKPKFYDGEDRDEVDLTIKNIQKFNRRLIRGESQLPDMVEARVAAAQRFEIEEKRQELDEWGEFMPEDKRIEMEEKYRTSSQEVKSREDQYQDLLLGTDDDGDPFVMEGSNDLEGDILIDLENIQW